MAYSVQLYQIHPHFIWIIEKYLPNFANKVSCYYSPAVACPSMLWTTEIGSIADRRGVVDWMNCLLIVSGLIIETLHVLYAIGFKDNIAALSTIPIKINDICFVSK